MNALRENRPVSGAEIGEERVMSAPVRAALVDSDPLARKRLATLLAVHSQIEIIGEVEDVEMAHEVCMRKHLDLLFLDVQPPRPRCFSLIPLMPGSPAIIFVTAYSQFAVQAFEVHALDYLLKPITPDRLADALRRVTSAEYDSNTPSRNGCVVLQETGRLRQVPVTDITHIEAQDNYTCVHLTNGPSAFIRRSLVDWEIELPDTLFRRVGRSLLVRIDAIRSLKAKSRDRTLITFAGSAKPVPVGRRGGLLVRRAVGK